MPRALSVDLRTRIVNACAAQELSQPEIAAFFDVHLKTVEKYWKLWRTTQSLDPKAPRGGSPPRLLAHHEDLRRWLAEKPDRTHRELLALLQEHKGVHASLSMVSRAVAQLGLPRKKRASARRSVSVPTWSKPAPTTAPPRP